jgi:hypothetical protein
VVQVSATKNWLGLEAALVLDGQHNVWECVRVGSSIGSPTLIASNIQEISASMLKADTVFTISADASHSVSEYRNLTAFWGIVIKSTPLGTPSSGGPFAATHISAGKDGATGQEAVFVNFNGAVYEHNSAGWSYVAGVNLSAPHSWWQIGFAISDMSASQVSADTVFAVDSAGWLLGGNNNLHVYVGQSTGANKPLSFVSVFMGSGMTQVSATVDTTGQMAAFTLTSNGSLDEYTLTGIATYTKSHIWDLVDNGLAASQIQGNTVYFESAASFGLDSFNSLFEYSPSKQVVGVWSGNP